MFREGEKIRQVGIDLTVAQHNHATVFVMHIIVYTMSVEH